MKPLTIIALILAVAACLAIAWEAGRRHGFDQGAQSAQPGFEEPEWYYGRTERLP